MRKVQGQVSSHDKMFNKDMFHMMEVIGMIKTVSYGPVQDSSLDVRRTVTRSRRMIPDQLRRILTCLSNTALLPKT